MVHGEQLGFITRSIRNRKSESAPESGEQRRAKYESWGGGGGGSSWLICGTGCALLLAVGRALLAGGVLKRSAVRAEKQRGGKSPRCSVQEVCSLPVG